MDKFAQTHEAIPAYLGSVGMFNDTKTIYASPVMTRQMYRLQAELYHCMKDCDTKGLQWYCPDNWVPHCTLALMDEDGENAFYKASELILREFEKMSGMFVAVGLVKITFPVKEIFTVKLSK